MSGVLSCAIGWASIMMSAGAVDLIVGRWTIRKMDSGRKESINVITHMHVWMDMCVCIG